MESEILRIIERALREDRAVHDITTNILVPKEQESEAAIISREEAVVSGVKIVASIFRRLDPDIHIQVDCPDGSDVLHNGQVMYLRGKTRSLLSGERVALNFLSYLSGIATLTRRFVKQAAPYKAKIMDTRKTIPGIRAVVKQAVINGGGTNHRYDLKEMVIIKDNHQVAYKKDKSVVDAILHVRRCTRKTLIVEVDSLPQFKEAIEASPDVILLDNMTPAQIRQAVLYNQKHPNRCLLEASGGVTLRNVRSIARTGVDRISIGALTHSPKAIDFSMEFKN